MPDNLSTYVSALTPLSPQEPVIGSFRLSETGLDIIGDPSFEEWLVAGKFIKRAEGSVHFWIGDWLNFGEHKWGERYREATELFNYNEQTLRNDKWIAGQISPDRRRSELSFSHHQEVADLEPDEQDALLAKAVSEKLNREAFRKVVREHNKPLSGSQLSGRPDKSNPAEEIISAILHLTQLLRTHDDTRFTEEQFDAIADRFEELGPAIREFMTNTQPYEDLSADTSE